MRGGRSGGRGFGGRDRQSGGGGGGGYRNPCLTMHQPWASLLVHGIKRIEGRSWPAPLTGRLWIHAASKVPDPDTVAAMEAFYREIHAVDGVAHIDFPQHYPVSRLLGCVDVVGCIRCEELVCWEDVPESVRLEALTDFCWLCENPQKLVVPFEMRGYQGVYNLERKIYEGAVRGLSPVQGPLPVKFPLPDPRNPFSLKPGSLKLDSSQSTLVKTSSVSAAIAGARAAANQYSRKDSNAATANSEVQRGNKSGENSSVVQDSPSHSHLPIIQKSPSYSQNQNRVPSVGQSSPSYSQNQNPTSAGVNTPSYSGNQNPPPTVHTVPSYLQNRIPVSIVGSIPIYSQGHNPPPVVHTIPSYPHNQIPVSIVGTIPIYSQRHNTSPTVQSRPSYSQNHTPSLAAEPSARQSGASNSPSVLQNQDAEPRRSPRLQSGASNRRR